MVTITTPVIDISESEMSQPGANLQSTNIGLTATTVQTRIADGTPQSQSTNTRIVATVVKRFPRTPLNAGTKSTLTTGVAPARTALSATRPATTAASSRTQPAVLATTTPGRTTTTGRCRARPAPTTPLSTTSRGTGTPTATTPGRLSPSATGATLASEPTVPMEAGDALPATLGATQVETALTPPQTASLTPTVTTINTPVAICQLTAHLATPLILEDTS